MILMRKFQAELPRNFTMFGRTELSQWRIPVLLCTDSLPS